MTDAEKERAAIVNVPMKDWIALHRSVGLAEGMLMGWLHWDGTPEHMERLKAVTRKHLDERGDHLENTNG